MPEDWDIKHPLSMKSIINKEYKCKSGKKNKRDCVQKYRKSEKCIDCLDNRISTIAYQIVTSDRDKKWVKKNKEIMVKIDELKEYLENINSDNKYVLKN